MCHCYAMRSGPDQFPGGSRSKAGVKIDAEAPTGGRSVICKCAGAVELEHEASGIQPNAHAGARQVARSVNANPLARDPKAAGICEAECLERQRPGASVAAEHA